MMHVQLPLSTIYLPQAGWISVSRITSKRKYRSVSIMFMCMIQILFNVLPTVNGSLLHRFGYSRIMLIHQLAHSSYIRSKPMT